MVVAWVAAKRGPCPNQDLISQTHRQNCCWDRFGWPKASRCRLNPIPLLVISQWRTLDDRIEMGSRGLFPGNITSAKLDRAGFKGRNALIAKNLYEFPCHRTFTLCVKFIQVFCS